MYKKNDAFTLIELLIVISIIGLLSAVLIPNLLSARNRSFDTVAQAYLREVVTMQEFEQIDNFSYTSDLAVLQGFGLKAIPNNVNFNIISADDVDYCMSSKSTKGSGKTFYATLANGVSTTVCP